MPVFWSVNKQIRTDTVFHIIICAKHGTSTCAAAPRAAKIWPRRAIFWPVPVTRYQRAPRRFCRSGVRGPRPSNHCTATSGNGSAAPRQRPGNGSAAPRYSPRYSPRYAPRYSPRYAPRLFAPGDRSGMPRLFAPVARPGCSTRVIDPGDRSGMRPGCSP